MTYFSMKGDGDKGSARKCHDGLSNCCSERACPKPIYRATLQAIETDFTNAMDKNKPTSNAHKAIESADDKYRSILEEAPLGVYQATAQGHLVYFNDALVKILGYDSVEHLNKAASGSRRGMYCTEQALSDHLKHVYSDARSQTVEMQLCRADGNPVWVSIQTRVVRDESGKPLYHNGFVTDISENKALQAETMRASQLASLGELAAGVAHEINNPLNAVINFAQLMEEDCADKTQADLLSRVIREGNRIAGIVRNLLSFSRMESEKLGPVDLFRVVADSLSLTQAQMEKEGIWLQLEVEDKLHPVRARAQELQQVCINLLSNARHALNEKYPGQNADKLLRLTVKSQVIDAGEMVLLVIRDNGCGISPEVMERVLDPFFSTKPKGVGTGLGLSISYKIVESQGGTMAISSEHGEYTEIRITLPVWREEQDG